MKYVQELQLVFAAPLPIINSRFYCIFVSFSYHGNMSPKITRISLTGGPCAGKSTALVHISERFKNLGYQVFCVPEAATLLITGGMGLVGSTIGDTISVQTRLISLQMALEDSFYTAALASEKPAIIIADRGTMDSSAFLEPHVWQAILDENGWTTVGLRDKRYDAVIHMVTAAKGAESCYTLANNAARTETPEQARQVDDKLIAAWTGHPHLRIIDNSTDFEAKIRRVLDALARIVGIPEPVEIERKYLVAEVGEIPVPHETVEIEQVYLQTSDGNRARIRKRGQRGAYTYFHTLKRSVSAGQRIEEERQITPREYASYLTSADPNRVPIHKTRTCFMWNSQYYELDRFISPCPGLILLEAELDTLHQSVTIPPWIKIVRDVTDEPQYTNATLAKKGGKS